MQSTSVCLGVTGYRSRWISLLFILGICNMAILKAKVWEWEKKLFCFFWFAGTWRIYECFLKHVHLLCSLHFCLSCLLSEQTRWTSTEEEKRPTGGESRGLWCRLRLQRSKCGFEWAVRLEYPDNRSEGLKSRKAVNKQHEISLDINIIRPLGTCLFTVKSDPVTSGYSRHISKWTITMYFQVLSFTSNYQNSALVCTVETMMWS